MKRNERRELSSLNNLLDKIKIKDVLSNQASVTNIDGIAPFSTFMLVVSLSWLCAEQGQTQSVRQYEEFQNRYWMTYQNIGTKGESVAKDSYWTVGIRRVPFIDLER